MIGFSTRVVGALLLLVSGGLFSINSHAAEKQAKASPTGIGSAWQTQIAGPGDVDGRTFDDVQLNLVREVDDYFNKIDHLQGRFAQTDAQDQTLKGKFYVQWPGRFRFDYSRPSRLVILSDGHYLRIEDHALKQTESYSLNSTPFRIILAKNVNIVRDARILSITHSDKELVIALQDRKEDSGVIQLKFNRGGSDGLELKEWIITDAQGLNTRVAVNNLVFGRRVNQKLFRGSKIGLPTAESRN